MITIYSTKFSLEGINKKELAEEFKTSLYVNGFIEILKGTPQEELDVIRNFIKEDFPKGKIVHVGNSTALKQALSEEPVQVIEKRHNESITSADLKEVLEWNPDVFIIQNNYADYRNIEYFIDLYMMGHIVIFY